MSLYHKYRPSDFDQMIGNQDVISYLKEVTEKEKTPHVLLFHGPTGCGKTTLARIVAKELGCDDLNLTEINTADFRGIDTVRDLIKKSKYQGIGGGNRTWIVDETHRWTRDAQEAVLKLLEECPEHVYFILCTTDPNKLIKTVRGRCMELEVKPLTEGKMKRLLKKIVQGEEVKELDIEVYDQIVQDSFGLPRNALQILEKVLNVDPKRQLETAKKSALQQSESIELCRALIRKSGWKEVRGILDGLKDQDAEGIRRHVLGYAQSVLLKGENDKAAHVLEEFIEPFYNSGFPMLVLACYSVIKG